MLKIKDNVDLKELTKFGFKERKHYYLTDIYGNGYRGVYISKETREIWIGIEGCTNGDLEKLYDLIKADLVEKVEDK